MSGKVYDVRPITAIPLGSNVIDVELVATKDDIIHDLFKKYGTKGEINDDDPKDEDSNLLRNLHASIHGRTQVIKSEQSIVPTRIVFNL